MLLSSFLWYQVEFENANLLGSLTLGMTRALLEEEGLALAQRLGLAVVDALQPVAEAGAAEGVHGVGPQRGLVEEGAHLDADLPEADSDACDFPC